MVYAVLKLQFEYKDIFKENTLKYKIYGCRTARLTGGNNL